MPAGASPGSVPHAGDELLRELLEPLQILRGSGPTGEHRPEPRFEVRHEPTEILAGPARDATRVDGSEVYVGPSFEERRLPPDVEAPQPAALLGIEVAKEREDGRQHRREDVLVAVRAHAPRVVEHEAAVLRNQEDVVDRAHPAHDERVSSIRATD